MHGRNSTAPATSPDCPVPGAWILIVSAAFPKEKTMFRNKWLASAMFAGLLVASGVARAEGVSFVEPKDGATVSNPVHVKFAVDGIKIAPAGTMTEGTGHHHLLIDGAPLPKGEVIPANDKSVHFGKGQTETDLTLPPGDHKLTLQFGDGAHRSYGPEMSKTITVHVK
jgi:hypothetical protein